MTDPTFFLAWFPGAGFALFSKVEDAQEWCERRAADRFPEAAVEWAEPEEETGAGTGRTGQQWLHQHDKAHRPVSPTELGSVVSLPLDAEV